MKKYGHFPFAAWTGSRSGACAWIVGGRAEAVLQVLSAASPIGGAVAPADWTLIAAGILALAQDDRDRRVHSNIVGSFGNDDLAEFSLIDSFNFHRRLVGFDLGDDIARL